MATAASVHPSATLHPDASIAAGVEVGPNVVVEADVVVETGARLMVGCVLHGGARIGEGAVVGPYAVVASAPSDHGYRGEPTTAEIGPRAQLREFVTVQKATGEGQRTVVGADSLVMASCHVSHNCRLGEGVVVTNLSQLGGHVEVGDGTVIGAAAMVHQWVRIGRWAMVGALSGVNTDLLPFCLARGAPARHFRLNRVGLSRRGLEGERYRTLERAVYALRRRDQATVEALAGDWPEVAELLAFVRASKRGVARFHAKGS